MKFFLLFSLLLLSIVAPPLCAEPIMERALAKQTIQHTDYGLRYLRSRQAKDGSWLNSVTVTSLALHAFTRSYRQYTEDDGPFITRSVNFLLSHIQEDGSISDTPGASVESTALAMIALQSLGNPAYNDAILRAQEYLKLQQRNEFHAVANPTDEHAALLSQALVMEAMKKTGLDARDPFWSKALAFVTRAQSVREDRELARDFVSSQLAALRCLLYAGVEKADPGVTSLWRRISKNQPLQKAEAKIATGDWFDGLNNFSKAMRAYGAAVAIDHQGQPYNWRNQTAARLLARYQPDGSWMGVQGDNADPVLVTAWSVNTLNQVVRSLRD